MEDSLIDYENLLRKDDKPIHEGDESSFFNTLDIYTKEDNKNKSLEPDVFDLQSKSLMNIDLHKN